jgi:UDP-N-acetylglucosamine--N-acetylmuramyl-(pentapeptide) pyrophosphoryl-undecaprenol N-acetylglucosamine transferase
MTLETIQTEVKKHACENQTILVASGASGGHVFPALAVADALKAKGFKPVFVGSGGKFLGMVADQGYKVIDLPASPWNVRNPLRKMLAIFNLSRAFLRALKVIHEEKASAVFGTGGYATVATVLAGKVSGIPTIVQEQNVLPGRANRFLSRWVDRVCLSFEASRHYLKYRDDVMVQTGNPVREKVLAAVGRKRTEKTDRFNILICGGSQGASIFSHVLPNAINLLPTELKKKVDIIQQVRVEDSAMVKDAYLNYSIDAETKPFFDDLEQRMVDCNVLIGRSGASTINEANIFGRAAIYVPLKLADGHQVSNARAIECKGAAITILQDDFTSEKLAETLKELMQDASLLTNMEKASLELSETNAAEKVAVEVANLACKDVMHVLRENK